MHTTLARTYLLASPYWIIGENIEHTKSHPSQSIDTRRDFHIATGDYFMNLATIIGFAEESLRNCGETLINPDLLKKAREDLVHVHHNYSLRKEK